MLSFPILNPGPPGSGAGHGDGQLGEVAESKGTGLWRLINIPGAAWTGWGHEKNICAPLSECPATYRRPLRCWGPLCPGGTLSVHPWPCIHGSGAPWPHEPFPQRRREGRGPPSLLVLSTRPQCCPPQCGPGWGSDDPIPGGTRGPVGEGRGVWLSSGSWLQGPVHLPPHPLTILPLPRALSFLIWRGQFLEEGVGTKVARPSAASSPQLPETSQVAAAFSRR